MIILIAIFDYVGTDKTFRSAVRFYTRLETR